MFKFFTLTLVFIIVFFPLGCSKDDGGPEITTGILTGIITDAQTSRPIAGVRIIIFNANSNAPAGSALSTASDGSYSVELNEGTYYLKLSKQGYEEVPPKDITPLPINLPRRQTVTYSLAMFPSSVSNAGSILGRVTTNASGVSGVSVIASKSGRGYSTLTDGNGNFAIYNVPADTYTVKGWIAGYTSSEATAIVAANAATSGVNLTLTAGGTGTVKGRITFLATSNTEVDVALTHPNTRETIPGLTAYTSNYNFTIANVPPGTYVARATYANDGKVMDPDWIIKNGEPFVTVSTDTVTRDFSVTGSANLLSPTNPSTSTQPVEITDTIPIFTWEAYPAADDYIIEVINASGKVIWGGFDSNWTVRNVIVPKPRTSVQYNSTGTATEALVPGKFYRWKIYVSKNDTREPTGWKLISASEDQRGIFKVVRP